MTLSDEQIIKELEAELNETVENFEIQYWDGVEYFSFTAGHAYKGCRSEDDAERWAKELVSDDLEDNKEIFNQDWLNGLMNQRIEGESFIDYAAQDAIDTDGWAHFLSHYDGDYSELPCGAVFWRD